MTEPTLPPTDKHARDMSAAEREDFIRQCKKLESASAQSKPVDTRNAKDMTPAERDAWWENHARRYR
jgi:hypothetical protein